MIEAVYWHHGSVHAVAFDSVGEADEFLTAGYNAGSFGELSPVGVFVDGEPRLVDGEPPSAEGAEAASRDYAKAKWTG